MTYILARLQARPESAGAMRNILVELVAQSRAEPGCVSYELYQRADDAAQFQTVEQWRDAAAVDAHMGAAHVGAAIRQLQALFATAPEIVRYDKLA